MAHQGVRGPDGRLPVRHRDVDVQRKDDLEPRQRPELLFHAPVPFPGGELLDEGVGEGVQPARREPHARLAGGPRHLAPQRG